MGKNNIIKMSIVSVLSVCLLSCSQSRSDVDVVSAVVPSPVDVIQHNGKFAVTASTIIAVENEEQSEVARYFTRLLGRSAGFEPSINIGGNGDICFITDKTVKPESYNLSVTEDKVEIAASDARGFFYAVQTLRLSLPADIDSQKATDAEWCIPVMEVKDSPRFAYRGFMLDVARYFMPKEELLRVIDCMAMLKLNSLHLHLTDDNGWRLEIKKYPKLTEVGAWRVDRGDAPFPDRRNPQKGEPTPIGGFYTQEDIKEIVAYAAERRIDVIPEIDIPAHSNSALAAYPEYACPVVDKFIGVLPGLGGKNADIIYCAGNEKVFAFLQDVFDEVMALFPSKYIHIGGDEAWKSNWEKCPLCQSRIRKEKLADEEALQGYFMKRMSKYIQGKGREVMGWDELTNSEVPEGAVVFGWQGFGNAALKAAAKGHRFVMTPARVLYLIRYQGPQWFEPLTYFGNNTLKDVYGYEPIQANWKPEYEDLLMGVQGSMWTEFCNSPEDVTYQVFPRLVALAETAWIPKGRKDWNRFQKGLDNVLAHLDMKGVVYAKSMYNIQHKSVPANGNVGVTLGCDRTDVEIRYTTDGSEPDVNSALYSDTINIGNTLVIKCASFKDGKQMGETLVLPISFNKATGKSILGAKNDNYMLTNGVRGSKRQSDFEWCAWSPDRTNTFTIDLGSVEHISKVSLGVLTNYGMAVHKPRSISIEISNDNKAFAKYGKKEFDDKEIFVEDNFVEDIGFEVSGDARFVKVTMESAGLCPDNHLRPGQASRYYFDEIIIE